MSLFKKEAPEAGPAGLDALNTSSAPVSVPAAQPEVEVAAVAEPAVPKTPVELQSVEAKAYVHDVVKTAITESVRAIFSEFAKAGGLGGGGLTREDIDLLRTPKETPEQIAAKAREKREVAQSKEQEAQLRRDNAARRANCQHRYPNATEAISLVHNLPSRQTAGICMLCQDLIEGRHWTILAPDVQTGKERAVIAEAHKDYQRVLQIEQTRS
jgi:hypothetical protein